MSIAPGNETAAVTERFFPGATIESVEGRPWLVFATVDEHRFSVRQLDPILPSTRIDIVHEFLARTELRTITPLIHTDRQGTTSFDARGWVDGMVMGAAIPFPDWRTLHLPASIETDDLGEIAYALGEFHREGSTTSLLARAPRFRIKESFGQVRRSLELNERVLGSEIRKESRARRWLIVSRVLLANAETNLERVEFLKEESLVIGHLALWGSHIITASENSPVFLDCTTIGATPAVVDLAQLLARNGPWSDDRTEQVLIRYAEANPISPLQRRLLPWLTALDAIASCGMLLARAHDERRPLSDAHRRQVFIAVDQQLELLEALGKAFVPRPQRQYRYSGKTSRKSSRS